MSESIHKKSLAGVLITIGIVFGDIGTSPLYVFQAITGQGKNFNHDLIMGGLSSVIWTLILLATVKYILFALNADNKGEGGIFALFALLKDKKKWVIIPALIGCSTLLADGFITPAISISSAVEGLGNVNPDLPIIPIVIGIIIILFSVQQFGTDLIGKAFGPVMLLWFIFLAYLGIINIVKNPIVLEAFNPWYALNMIINVPGGFWVLGAVFLCTTGAEALYSDLGHCGKGNIRLSWVFVSSMLVLNYLGQSALCMSEGFSLQPKQTVFYAMVSPELIPFAIIIATAATIIASQALITGVFTLMNEAIKLKLWTNLKVKYPTNHKGQIYIPHVNWFLMLGCIFIILVFKEAAAMEEIYGLAITIDMVMTSILLCLWLLYKYPRRQPLYISLFVIFLTIEGIFLFSNLAKIGHGHKFENGSIAPGAEFTLILASSFFVFLYLFFKARQLRSSITEYIPMEQVKPLIKAIQKDTNMSFEASNIVFPTRSTSKDQLDSTVFYAMFRKKPRKAGIYWFVHVEILNEPWGVHYSANEIIDKSAYYILLQFGFKEEHRTEFLIRKIHNKMVEKGELTGDTVFKSMKGRFTEPDFKFIVLNSRISSDNDLSWFQNLYVKAYRFIKSTGLKPAEDFGLDKTNVVVEYVPISVTTIIEQEITEDYEDYTDT
ncbi:MAG: potassium transporter Kup [Bacteroidetes bacterium]|nr:potassium transporter Kup [Bacteroidota bacterium]